ncbi:MAG: agmatinase [Candidatus Aminicenantes bacterium]|nr:agmatinase [Candidatus Aminicenantes bacterium]
MNEQIKNLEKVAGKYKLALLGIPHDANSSYLKGTSAAPPLIREAFHCYSSNKWSESGIDLGGEEIFFDAGDLQLKNIAGDEDFPTIEKAVLRLVDNHLPPISFGGDHAVSLPVIRAMLQRYEKIDILQFDAHPDLYDSFENNPFSHACLFARVMESGQVNRLVQVGIRTRNAHQRRQAERFAVEMIEMRRLSNLNPLLFTMPLYISFDLDALDPAFAPGLSHPEPGGLTVRQALRVIQELSAPRIIGADIVEYNPRRDPSGITAMVAAKIFKEIAARMLECCPL